MLTHLHSRWFICFPKLRFSDQRKTPQWQTGLCPNNKKRPFRNFHSKWPYSLQRQEAFGSLMFYSRSDPEPAFLICVYRYKSHNHINTRYCWRQSHFFYILYLDHSKIYDIYSSKTPFVFYKMSQRFFLYRTTITKQINTANFV